ncbi:hypothetical protein GCM10029978_045950 [Actinoallomurus acanthiterrae]
MIDRLTYGLAGSVSGEQVAEAVWRIHRSFDGKPVRDFVPVLVERFAREELRSSAGGSGGSA